MTSRSPFIAQFAAEGETFGVQRLRAGEIALPVRDQTEVVEDVRPVPRLSPLSRLMRRFCSCMAIAREVLPPPGDQTEVGRQSATPGFSQSA